MQRTAAALIVLGFTIGEAAWPADPAPIGPGFDETRTLGGAAVDTFAVSAAEPILITVQNRGRGTVLTFRPEAGEPVRRAANWRGIEHRYTALIEAGSPGVIEIAADEVIGPPGQYRLRVRRISAEDPDFAAERAMFRGSEFGLRHYFDGGDFRLQAIEQYERAAAEFESARIARRRADALFEAAVVYMSLGEHDEALAGYDAARQLWTLEGDERGVAAADMHAGLVFWRTSRPNEALDRFRRAADRREALGDEYHFAQALNNIGLVYRDLGDARSALDFFRQALILWQGEADLLGTDPRALDLNALDRPPYLSNALIAINNLGWAYEVMADTENTRIALTQGLALSRYLKRGRLEAEFRSNLGRLEFVTGNLQLALDYLDEALDYFARIAPDEVWAANVHHSRARVFRASGDTRRARIAFEEALRLRTEERDPAGRAITLLELAELQLEAQRPDETRSLVERALSLLGAGRANRPVRANARILAGRALHAEARHAEAIDELETAIDTFTAAGDRRGEARARAYRAESQYALGLNLEAAAGLRVALELAEQVQDRLLEVQILVRAGRIAFLDGDQAVAKRRAEAAIERSEALRDAIVNPLLLRDFAAVQRDAIDLLIHAELAAGEDRAAFLAADTGRARLFADRISAARDVQITVDRTSRRRYEALRHMRAALADERTALLSRVHLESNEERLNIVEAELASVIDEIDRLQSTATSQIVRGSSPADLDSLSGLLANDAAILEFHVGPLGSGLFFMTADDLQFQPLPADDALTPQIESAVSAIRSPQPRNDIALEQLSRLLLKPLADHGRPVNHLIVVPDGPLYHLPFAVLYDPANGFNEPLVMSRDISYLPSVSALNDMRAAGFQRRSGQGIAVVADPVFDADDSRVLPTVADQRQIGETFLSRPLERSALRAGGESFPRLPGTREESRIISSVAGDRPVHTLLDTDANIDAVLNGDLRNYGILHFATHGILDPEEPALSGLVLSGVTPDGAPRRQFLRSQDIAGLDLRADLVVLSGCETALGRIVRGEGLHSLSRAFFYAGARQVVSTLWQVPDQATALLMRQLYTGMLVNGERPVRALRLAMLEVRSHRRWRHPYFWAAFIAQGDWQNTVASSR